MSVRKRVGLVVVLALVLAQSGCLALTATAVGGGAVGVAWLAGKTTRVVDGSLEESAMAVESALHDLGLPIADSRGGPAQAAIDSRLSNGDPVMIELNLEAKPFPSDAPRTRIGIRVATFGDEQSTKRIFEQIEYRLKNPAPPPLPAAPGALPPPPARSLETEEPPLARK